MSQLAKNKYSIEKLKELNVSYDHEHWLTQEDVDMANNHVQLIERTRSEVTPQIGDRLVAGAQKKDAFPYVNSRMCRSCGKKMETSV